MDVLLCSLEAFALVSALSLDAFAASFAYGANRIKIPLKSGAVINFVCSGMLGLSLVVGAFVRNILPEPMTAYISFAILFLFALSNFFDFAIKRWIQKSGTMQPKAEFCFLNFRFLLQVICDATQADADASKELSAKEALTLAIALSLDGLAVGFGSGLVTINYCLVLVLSFVVNIAAVMIGGSLGNKVAGKTELNLSWVGGAVLMLLAFTKLL